LVNLVYQCYIGDMKDRWIPYSVQSASDYADRIGADYIFSRSMSLEGSNPNRRLDRYFNILDLIYDPMFEKYDHILYLDVDILVNTSADNIFNVEGIMKDTDVIGSFEYSYKLNEYRENEEVFKKHGSFLIPSKIPTVLYRFINTGVIVFTKKGRERARLEWDVDWRDFRDTVDKGLLTADQPYINAMLNKHNFNVLELDEEWNYPVDDINGHSSNKVMGYLEEGEKINFLHCHFDSMKDFSIFSKKIQNRGFTFQT